MSNHLDKFIEDHREAFDDETPDPKILARIHEKMRPAAGEPAKVIPIGFKKMMSAAAALLLIAGAAILYFVLHKPAISGGELAKRSIPVTVDSVKVNPIAKTMITDSQTLAHVNPPEPHLAQKGNTVKDNSPADEFGEEMTHYAALVEIKHREIKRLEKDEPLLYKQFAGDVNKLDSVYQSLKTELPKNSNREQVIEAMIQNLQLQIGLLNRQLDIIKQINHSKKSAYEKAYKSV